MTVLAYAVGEEGFTDINGNGLADQPGEMFDANGVTTDMGEAYVDWNENGVHDVNEPFFNYGGTSGYDGPDGKYNGILCDPNVVPGSTPTACNLQKSIHVRDWVVLVFSGSNAFITITPTTSPVDLGGCGPGQTIVFDVRDLHGNVMPAGTKIDVSTTNGKLSLPNSFLVPNTNLAPPPNQYSIGLSGDGTMTAATASAPAACTDSTASGTLTVTVTTPLGIITTKSINVIN